MQYSSISRLQPEEAFVLRRLTFRSKFGGMNPKLTYAIRMTLAQREALEKISHRTGQDVSSLIRTAIQGLVDHYHASGDRLILPLDIGTRPPSPPPLQNGYSMPLVAEDPPERTPDSRIPPKPGKPVTYRKRPKKEPPEKG